MGTFRFKQFSIAQDKCAQKVGTDGVLLGAWTGLDTPPHHILDVGTGTGVIALMLAQRSPTSRVDAVEIDRAASLQARENFRQSPWSDRLECRHASLQQYALERASHYDLIISNPPFFQEKSRPESMQETRANARFETTLNFNQLIAHTVRLLRPNGLFAVVLPWDRHLEFVDLCTLAGLGATRMTHVKGTETAAVKRVLMEFRFRESVEATIPTDLLVIERSRHIYTAAYRALVQEFYLAM